MNVPNLSDTDVWGKTNTTEPTVNDNGSYTYTSTDYGDVTVTVPNLSDPSVWTNTEHDEPDEYTDGRDVYTSVYGEIEVTLPALGHTHSLTQVAAKEATCTAAGNGAYWTCSGCGKHFSDENGETEISIPTISALGHDYADGKCTRCGEDDPSHEHNFVNGECICGEPDPDYDPTSDPSHKHTFMNGVCDCGAIDPTYNTNNTNGEVTSDTPIENVLTPEEIAEINNGHSFEIVLEVTDIRNSVSYTDVAAASSVLNSGQEIGVYLDLSLFKVMDGTVRTQITDANGPIGITLTIPNDIYASDRTYYIIRVHNGTAENIGGTYDRTNNTLTFYTDKFSTYAIAYTASSVSIDSPTIPSRPSVPTVPTNPTPVTPSVSPSVSPSEPDVTPTVTETAPQVEEEVISDDEPYIEDVSSGAADDSDDGGITDMSMEVIILAIAAVIVAVILVKKIIF